MLLVEVDNSERHLLGSASEYFNFLRRFKYQEQLQGFREHDEADTRMKKPQPTRSNAPIEGAPVLWDTATVARIVGKSIVTMVRYRMLGGGPKWKRLGQRHIRYRREDVLAWIDSCPDGHM